MIRTAWAAASKHHEPKANRAWAKWVPDLAAFASGGGAGTDALTISPTRPCQRCPPSLRPSLLLIYRPLGGIFRRLVLNLGIQFGTKENDDSGHPHPDHKADGRSERSVGGVVIAVIT